MVLEVIHPKESEKEPQETENEEEKPNFPKYSQYSLGFTFLGLITLSLMSLFV